MLTKAHIEKVKVSEEVLDEVLNFKYIGGMIRAVGVMGEEMTYRLHENMRKEESCSRIKDGNGKLV